MQVWWLVFASQVEDEIRPQWVARGLRLPRALVVELVDQDTTQKILNVNLGKFKMAISALLMTPDGGKRKGIVWTREEPR